MVFGGKTARSRDRHVASLLDKGFATQGMSRPLTVRAAPSVVPPPRKPEQFDVVEPAPRKPEIIVAGSAGGAVARTAGTAVKAPIQTAAAASPKPDDLEAGPWGVQVGAFYSYRSAKKAAKAAVARVPDLLAQTSLAITNVKGQRGKIHRARLVGMSKGSARTACRRLKEMKTDCMVIRDRTGLKLAQNTGS